MTVDLSVIIPCRNVADTIEQQLDALGRQVWDGEWEVIVVDNGSSDATAVVAEHHAALRGRLRVVDAPTGLGVSYARRTGVLASTGSSVAFCDGDDEVADGWVAAMGEALRQHPAVTGAIDLDRLNHHGLRVSRGHTDRHSPPLYGEVTFLRGNNCGMQRAVWDLTGGFDDKFLGLEDIELSLRMAEVGVAVHFASDALVHYRYRSTLRALWSQGTFYGRSYPVLDRLGRRLGLRVPARWRGIRSWVWLAITFPLIWRQTIRFRWVWTLACRIGALRSSLALAAGRKAP